MKRFGWMVAALAVTISWAPASEGKEPAAKSAYTAVDWQRKPSEDELRAAFPSHAAASTGQARITCIVSVQGLLRNCKVESEKPEGQGFGEAALAMAPQFLMRPATVDGRPVESPVTIPLNFDCEGSCKNVAEGGRKILSGLNWALAPTQEQMVAAYPPKARAAHILGVASIQCELNKLGGLKTARR